MTPRETYLEELPEDRTATRDLLEASAALVVIALALGGAVTASPGILGAAIVGSTLLARID